MDGNDMHGNLKAAGEARARNLAMAKIMLAIVGGLAAVAYISGRGSSQAPAADQQAAAPAASAAQSAQTAPAPQRAQALPASPAPAAPPANELDCAVDAATDRHFCYIPREVDFRANGQRWAPLYVGGPSSVRRSGLLAAADCGSGALHLKDRHGASVAAASLWDTPSHGRELRRKLCRLAPPSRQ